MSLMSKDEEKSKQSAASTPQSVEERPSLKRRRIVIVGGGQTGRALVRGLSDAWDIALLDVDSIKLERLREDLPNRPLFLLAKDGTSIVNLREAGIEDADWLAAVTDYDEVNIEACRLARSLEKPPITIGIVRQPEGAEKLKAAGAEAVTRPLAIAGLLANRIERGKQVAVDVGLGQGEIVEIPVLPSSPAVDARVRDLRAIRWLVAAIYRGGKFIVPHGHAIIREGDRLLLTGDPEVLPYVSDYLRAGVARFPLQYGIRTIALPGDGVPDRFWSEVEFLCNSTRTRALRVIASEGISKPELTLDRASLEHVTVEKDEDAGDVLLRDLANLDCGCLVLEKKPPSRLNNMGVTRPPFAVLLDALPCPLLLAAGSHPYRRIWLPVTDSQGSLLAAELALDLSRQLDLQIAAVVVAPPTFIVGEETAEEQKKALKTMMHVASLYHVKLEQIFKEGNPGIEIANLAGEGDLLVISHRAGRRPSFFNPDTSLQIIQRSPCSVLALSYRERVHGAG
jgi:Trk K+ transport system NAD-binding subunit/nucleotide-binding universal stress UspA family protein